MTWTGEDMEGSIRRWLLLPCQISVSLRASS